MKKFDSNPMHRANAAPRCSATSRRSGKPCRAPAVRGWTVCRMHGAGGGAKPGRKHPNWKHGGRTHEAIALRKMMNEMCRESREMLEAIMAEESDAT